MRLSARIPRVTNPNTLPASYPASASLQWRGIIMTLPAYSWRRGALRAAKLGSGFRSGHCLIIDSWHCLVAYHPKQHPTVTAVWCWQLVKFIYVLNYTVSSGFWPHTPGSEATLHQALPLVLLGYLVYGPSYVAHCMTHTNTRSEQPLDETRAIRPTHTLSIPCILSTNWCWTLTPSH